MKYQWLCPRCGGHSLDVVVEVTARLDQYKDGNFETDTDCSDHEWGENSVMSCRDCGNSDIAGAFEVQP